jgi:hypothetical protein
MAFNGVVDAPTIAAARFGLLSVAEVVNHAERDEHWISKVRWRPRVSTFDVDIVDVCGDLSPEGIVAGVSSEPGEATGFGIDVTDLCTTTFGTSFAEQKTRIKEITDTVTQYAAEHQLWSEFDGEGIMDVVGATDVSLKYALSKIEQAIGGGSGFTGVIHMSRENATLLIAENLICQSGANPGQLETLLGTPVVAGHGYSSDRIYGSGPIVLHLGPVVVYDGQNISINDIITKAERPAEFVWDASALVAATPRTELTS